MVGSLYAENRRSLLQAIEFALHKSRRFGAHVMLWDIIADAQILLDERPSLIDADTVEAFRLMIYAVYGDDDRKGFR